MMKRVSIIVTTLLLLATSTAFAEGLSVGISANNRVVGTNLGLLTSSPYGTLEVGGGILYNKHRYTISNALVSVKSDALSPGLRYGLGFKYVMGNVKNNARTHSGDLSALGFNFDFGYELPATVNPTNVPMEFVLNATYAPQSITFDETEEYMDATAALRFYLLENAYLVLSYAYIDTEFDTGGTWSRYINEFTIGTVLTF